MKDAAQTKKFCWRGVAVLIALAGLFCGCQKAVQQQQALGPKTFPSPESAGKAVYSAAKAQDTNAVLAIFGREGREYLLTEDPTQDQAALKEFAGNYEQMHRWAALEGGGLVLDVGAENYPFPFPLVKTATGSSPLRHPIPARHPPVPPSDAFARSFPQILSARLGLGLDLRSTSTLFPLARRSPAPRLCPELSLRSTPLFRLTPVRETFLDP